MKKLWLLFVLCITQIISAGEGGAGDVKSQAEQKEGQVSKPLTAKDWVGAALEGLDRLDELVLMNMLYTQQASQRDSHARAVARNIDPYIKQHEKLSAIQINLAKTGTPTIKSYYNELQRVSSVPEAIRLRFEGAKLSPTE